VRSLSLSKPINKISYSAYKDPHDGLTDVARRIARLSYMLNQRNVEQLEYKKAEAAAQDINHVFEDAKRLKNYCRKHVPPSQRRMLWKGLLKLKAAGSRYDAIYQELKQQIFPDPSITPDDLPSIPDFGSHLNWEYQRDEFTVDGCRSVQIMLCVLATHHPDISFCPMIVDFIPLLMEVLTEGETYAAMSHIIKRSKIDQWFFTIDARSFAIYRESFVVLLSTKAPLVAKHFKAVGVDVGKLFQSWYSTFFAHLPEPSILRLMDCFLSEGSKVFYRVAVALLKTHVKTLTNISSAAAVLDTLEHTMLSTVNADTLFAMAFALPISREELIKIDKTHQRIVTVPNAKARIFHIPYFLPSQSDILSVRALYRVWSWLPDSMQIHNPTLLFASGTHGYSIRTMLECVGNRKHVLVIRDTSGHVFGVFMPQPWRSTLTSTNYNYAGSDKYALGSPTRLASSSVSSFSSSSSSASSHHHHHHHHQHPQYDHASTLTSVQGANLRNALGSASSSASHSHAHHVPSSSLQTFPPSHQHPHSPAAGHALSEYHFEADDHSHLNDYRVDDQCFVFMVAPHVNRYGLKRLRPDGDEHGGWDEDDHESEHYSPPVPALVRVTDKMIAIGDASSVALQLDDRLSSGVTGKCTAFQSPPLSYDPKWVAKEDESKSESDRPKHEWMDADYNFKCLSVECWGFQSALDAFQLDCSPVDTTIRDKIANQDIRIGLDSISPEGLVGPAPSPSPTAASSSSSSSHPGSKEEKEEAIHLVVEDEAGDGVESLQLSDFLL